MNSSLYSRVRSLAEGPYAERALAAVAFAESSFFPIPPDVLLAPMALANPKRAWRYALIATIASVIGGMLGYAIGALLYNTVGQWLDQSLRLWRKDGCAERDLRPMGLAGDPRQGRNPDPL